MTENPLTAVDAAKGGIMNEFKDALMQERKEDRYMIEQHVRQ